MPLILPGNVASATAVAGYDVANSCRFDGSSASMSITPGSNMNLDRWTWSGWIKRSGLGVVQSIFSCDNATTDTTELAFDANDKLNFLNLVSSVIKGKKITTRVFRDPSAWYHIVVVWDSGNATAGDRIKIYVNGVRETVFDTSADPDQNTDSSLGESGLATLIGVFVGESSRFFNGYMAEVVLIDGTAYAASDFGEFDEDSPTIWKPIDVSGLTFGTHGFYLDFEASDNLGNDANGGTDLSETNLAAVDQATDTPTNSFCTFNSIATTNSVGNTLTFAEGNCKITNTSDGGWTPAIGNMGATNGKWYAEFKVSTIGGASKYGIIDVTQYLDNVNFASTGRAYSYEYYSGDAYNNGNYDADYGDSFTTDDIISVAMDLDNMKLYFAKNGTWQDSGDPTSGATGTGTHAYFGGGSNSANAAGVDTYAFAANIHNSSVTEANFGNPSYANSSSNADGNGYGDFEYAVPSGYYALCTKNLAEYG